MKKVLVFGAARSGCAVARLLAQQGYQVTISDIALIPEADELEKQGVTVFSACHPEQLKVTNWDFVVKNPGINYHHPFIQAFSDQHIPIFNETEIALWYSDFTIAAVSGTNGKTTTTTLLGEILKLQYENSYTAGNIGLPLSAIVSQGNTQGYVALEISAQQLLATPSFKPKCAVIMNLSPDHLDYFADLAGYYQAKMLICDNMKETDYFLLNLDDETILQNMPDTAAKIITFSLEKPADVYRQGEQIRIGDQLLFEVSDLKIPGEHNLQNAMVAATMAYLLKVETANIGAALRAFKGVEHRIELVRELNGVVYYNDSKATNAESTIICLKAFSDKPLILLAGGYDKKTGFAALAPYLKNLKRVILYGETKEEIAQYCRQALVVDNLQEALEAAYSQAVAGDIVVLSPACASFDQFANFEARGEYFKELVLNLQ